jgi:protein SCO1/2
VTDLPTPVSTPTTRPWSVSALSAALAVVLVLGGAWVYARVQSAFPYYGTAYTPPLQAQTFSGTVSGVGGQPRPWTFRPGQGSRATALFFGFTHCPNICPLGLASLEKARQALAAEDRDIKHVLETPGS